jgi:hypothetical protein
MQQVKLLQPCRVAEVLLMRQAAQPWSEVHIGDEGEHVVISEKVGGNTIHTAEEEVVKHPVKMEDHVIMCSIGPHIMPCTMRYGGVKHEGHAVLTDEVGT